ncbi:MAG: RNA polymerase sigma factor [Planctomycetia bacterium]|nr:RNA polymerase sigma factor [Planctomycetia bacterium]
MAIAAFPSDPISAVLESLVYGLFETAHTMLLTISSGNEDARHNDAITDRCDVRACLHGDRDAYSRLVRRHQQSVGSLLWRFTHDRLEHESLVHDAFVEAYFSLRTYRSTGSFRSWLLTIATRVGYGLWKQRARTRRRNVVSLDGIPEPAADGVEPRPEDACDLLGQALARLAPRDCMVLTLLYLEEMSVAEVATLTGWSRTLVKVQAHRARGRLRKLVQKKDDASQH